LPGEQVGGGSILGADDGSRSCHGHHRRPDCRSLLSPANLAGLPAADLTGLPTANVAGIPGADLAGLPAADLADIPGADASAGDRSVASHPSDADGHIHAADHTVGRGRGSDDTALRCDVDARHAAAGSERVLAAAVLPVPIGVRGHGGCFIAGEWMVVAGFRGGAGECRGT
jgi:hypothetical protein